MNTVTLLKGDCLQKLKELKDNSIDSVVTDPPYEIGFMNKGWDDSGIANNPELWKEVLRVLKPGGHLLSFSHSRTYHRQAVAVEDAGFEIRDQIMWIYGSGFPKSHNIGHKVDEYQGWGTALKPAHEPIVMARKPFKGSVANNVLEWGTGGINIDGCRIGTEKVSIHHADSSASETYGWNKGDKKDSSKDYYENEGRFPANIIFDEEAGKILDEQSGISKSSIYDNSKGNTTGFHDSLGRKKLKDRDDVGGYNDTGGASRFFYCPKTSKTDRNEGVDGNVHPTVKPTDLMAYLVRMVTPKGGTVLDPFMGSGSTGKASVREGFDFIGIEREDEYMEIAKSRIEHEQKKHNHRKFFDAI